jgi:hypothetical protein
VLAGTPSSGQEKKIVVLSKPDAESQAWLIKPYCYVPDYGFQTNDPLMF